MPPCSPESLAFLKVILERLHPGKEVLLEFATDHDDKHEATDFMATIGGKNFRVGVRKRERGCRFRDLTVRWESEGSHTEWPKLKRGEVQWYFYYWLMETGDAQWVLIDVKKMHALGLFTEEELRKQWKNFSGDPQTQGAAISVFRLHALGCIVCGDVEDFQTENAKSLRAKGLIGPIDRILMPPTPLPE